MGSLPTRIYHTNEKAPPATADSDPQSSSLSTLLPLSDKPGLQDTPDSQISTEDDTAAAGVASDRAKPYDPAAVGKKSHDRAVARAILKLKKPSPCLSTPSPKSVKPILDNTPTSQIRRIWSFDRLPGDPLHDVLVLPLPARPIISIGKLIEQHGGHVIFGQSEATHVSPTDVHTRLGPRTKEGLQVRKVTINCLVSK